MPYRPRTKHERRDFEDEVTSAFGPYDIDAPDCLWSSDIDACEARDRRMHVAVARAARPWAVAVRLRYESLVLIVDGAASAGEAVQRGARTRIVFEGVRCFPDWIDGAVELTQESRDAIGWPCSSRVIFETLF